MQINQVRVLEYALITKGPILMKHSLCGVTYPKFVIPTTFIAGQLFKSSPNFSGNRAHTILAPLQKIGAFLITR